MNSGHSGLTLIRPAERIVRRAVVRIEQGSGSLSRHDVVCDCKRFQAEFTRALDTWAAVSGLTFTQVSDDGSASGTSGMAQGDSRFGDIRLGAHDLSSGAGYAYYPVLALWAEILLSTQVIR
jgi:hypothetical protein